MKKKTLTGGLFFAFFSVLAHAENENPYYFDKLQLPSAWGITRGSPEITVAVINTGVSYQYLDQKNLALNSGESGNGFETDGIDNDGNGYIDDIYGINALENTSDPTDKNGLGTHVASLIASLGFGVAPNVKVLPIAICNAQGTCAHEAVVKGLQYAISRKVDLISFGVGGGLRNEKICEIMRSSAIPIIVPAGNSGMDLSDPANPNPFFPLNCEASNILAVASVDEHDTLSTYSNYGKDVVHLAAPGKDIWGIHNNGTIWALNGASLAAGLTVGVAALVLSLHPEYTFEQLFRALMTSVDHTEELTQKTISGGRLNAYQALLADIK